MGHIFQILKRGLFPYGVALLPLAAAAQGPHARLTYALESLTQAGRGLVAADTCELGVPPPGDLRYGGDGGLCDDLYRFSCAPGAWSDGTGRAGGREAVRERVAKLRANAAAKATREFSQLLKTKRGAYLRQLGLSAFGLAHAPGCADPKNEACTRILCTALGKQVAKNLFPRSRAEEPAAPRPASLRELDLLTQNALFRRLEKKVGAEARAALRNRETEDRIEKSIFPKVQKLLVNLLDRKVVDPALRKILVTKISSVSFDGTDCASPVPPDATGESYNPSLTAMLEPNAFYTPNKNTFRFCNGFLLRNQSEFQIASVVAHELAHAIDPCLITHGPRDFRFEYSAPFDRVRSEQEYPLPGLLACLRSEQSVGARFLSPGADPEAPPGTPPRPDPAKNIGELEAKVEALNARIVDKQLPLAEREKLRDEKNLALGELARARRVFNEERGGPMGPDGIGAPGAGGPPPPANAFCEQDQIGESLSDWVANEILPAYIKQNHPRLNREQRQVGYSNVFRGMCDKEAMLGEGPPRFDVHPESYRRANFLMLAQPEVRRQMGCPREPAPDVIYCQVPDAPRAPGSGR